MIDLGDSGGGSSTDSTDDSVDFEDPDDALREAAGASSGAIGSEILASGGDPVAGAISITGSGSSGSDGPDWGTVDRLVESEATDAPSDIAAKASGETDPNPGHTSPEEAMASAQEAASNALPNAGLPDLSGLLELPEPPEEFGSWGVVAAVGGAVALGAAFLGGGGS